MDIFAHENIGCRIPCLLEKSGERSVDFVKWTHAMVGAIVNRKMFTGDDGILKVVRSNGWTVVEVGVE